MNFPVLSSSSDQSAKSPVTMLSLLFALVLIAAPLTSGLQCLQSGRPNTTLISPLTNIKFISCITLTTSCSADTNLLFSNFIAPPSVPTNSTLSSNNSAAVAGTFSISQNNKKGGAGTTKAQIAARPPVMLCSSQDTAMQHNVTLYTGVTLPCVQFLASFNGVIGSIVGSQALGAKPSQIAIGCCGTDNCNVGSGGTFANGTLFFPGEQIVTTTFEVGGPATGNGGGAGAGNGTSPNHVAVSGAKGFYALICWSMVVCAGLLVSF